MTQTRNELIGYWSSETQFDSTVYIRFTGNRLLQWGYENEWRICNISHSYWIENESIGTICLPNPRKEFTSYSITADGLLKLNYTNRETVWEKAEKQEFFDCKNIWNPGIPFARQIDYMALLKSAPHHFQVERAKNMNVPPQILVNTNALWKCWEYAQAEFASLHLDDFEFILEQGVLIDEDDDMDTTLLSHLAHDGYTEAVTRMLNKGADINHVDILQNTALDWAIWKNQVETIKILQKKGAKLGSELTNQKLIVNLN